jgi:sterol desaturase/sphingolipid hydroxylase (fatty acid hydroxylase superfamily)
MVEAAVRLGAFAGMLALLALWETLAPRRTLRLGRRRWSANLTLALLNTVVVRFAVPLGTYGAAELAAARGWGLLNLTTGPPVLEFLVAVLVMDFVVYLQHRLFQVVPVLWRFRKVHHADNDFDVTTGLRFHTVSMVISMAVKMTAAVLLGASPFAVLVSGTALNLTAMFNHAKIRIAVAVDRVLRWFIVTPDMHRVHHSVDTGEMSRNFGFNFPWWDRLLGTYRDQPAAGHTAIINGLREYQADTRQTLFWMVALPFRRRRVPQTDEDLGV